MQKSEVVVWIYLLDTCFAMKTVQRVGYMVGKVNNSIKKELSILSHSLVFIYGSSYENRTRVSGVRSQRPRPLDE